MNAKKVAKVTLVLLAVFVMFIIWTDEALAADAKPAADAKSAAAGKPAGGKATSTADHDLASKKGMSVLEGGKKSDPTKKATTLQKTIGVASIFVMIAVVKWL